jgi:Trypsin-like peptidase domain
MPKNDTPKELLQALDLIRGTRRPKPESLDSLESTQVDRVRNIFEDRNIVAIGIAEKVTEKRKTGHLGLCFYVEKKLPRSKLNPNKMLPPVLSVAGRKAVFTDVQQIGKIVPQINKRLTPLMSGFSVGNDTDTGTLGALVRKGGKLFILSNSHVLARAGKGKKGDHIFYPGEADTSGEPQKVGELSNIFPFKPGNDFLNKMDVALARVDGELDDALDFSIRGAKLPLATADPVRGMKVLIRGRTSGDSEGEVDDINFSTTIDYGGGVGVVGFLNQVKCTRYSKGGDSGSIVVDKKSGKIVGLHFAGSPDGSIFTPINTIIKALKFKFVSQ